MAEERPQSGLNELVEAAMAGDHGALRALWAQHRRWVAAVILAHKPSSAEVDDLLQDVAITLLAKIKTLDEPGAFVPWLRMVALNTARLAGRRHAAAPRTRSLDTTGGGSEAGARGGGAWEPETNGRVPGLRQGGRDNPGTRATTGEESGRLMRLAAELPEEYREPLLLRCVQELSYRQISAIMDLPETTIETRIARARRMLRERAGVLGEAVGSAAAAKPTASAATAGAPSQMPFLPSHPHPDGGVRVRVLLDPDRPRS